MSNSLVRETRFTSFDGSISLVSEHQRPDRYHHLELADRTVHRIPRGGGYSYSAASFGDAVLVQEMTRFNRFLAFDAQALTLTLEPGVRLIDLLRWALPRGLYFPVLPGYPFITVGGCVAADVHGKNPWKDGTFADWVKQLTVYHPAKGYQQCSADDNAALFSLTCGGFGLSGIITAVTLQLTGLPGSSVATSRTRVANATEALQELSAADADIAYSWHDATHGRNFGRGVVHLGHWSEAPSRRAAPRFRQLTAESRARLPFSAWNRCSAGIANFALAQGSRFSSRETGQNPVTASFPFGTNILFHALFGRPGLREAQVLIGDAQIHDFLQAVERLVRALKPPTFMLSLKRFKGSQSSLSMTGSGYLVAVDCYRNPGTEAFMQRFVELMLECKGQPNLSKDSGLERSVVEAALPGFSGFEKTLNEYDPDRLMRSELSRRMGLS